MSYYHSSSLPIHVELSIGRLGSSLAPPLAPLPSSIASLTEPSCSVSPLPGLSPHPFWLYGNISSVWGRDEKAQRDPTAAQRVPFPSQSQMDFSVFLAKRTFLPGLLLRLRYFGVWLFIFAYFLLWVLLWHSCRQRDELDCRAGWNFRVWKALQCVQSHWWGANVSTWRIRSLPGKQSRNSRTMEGKWDKMRRVCN